MNEVIRKQAERSVALMKVLFFYADKAAEKRGVNLYKPNDYMQTLWELRPECSPLRQLMWHVGSLAPRCIDIDRALSTLRKSEWMESSHDGIVTVAPLARNGASVFLRDVDSSDLMALEQAGTKFGRRHAVPK
jgi:hypothetical protein